ncbi:MAG: mechanosensitive ion channel, partial [Planctomycetaceae bacterium]|nr:mechanosensitive ion channel [Planctomycetaceae bacterium]
ASQSPGTGYAIGAFGRNEVVVALTVGCLEFIRVVCRGNGLGISHFQWPKRVNDLVSSTISSFLTIATPLALVIALLRARSQPEETQAFERVLMIAINLLLAGVMYRLTVPKTGLLKEWIEAHPSGWLAKLSGLIHWVAVAVPLILAVLTVVGYTYAAEHLSMKLTQAVFLIFGVVFARALIIRWLMLRQRRLAIEQARELRAAMAQSDRERDVNLQDAQEARTNLAEVSAQSKRLVNSLAVIGTFVGLGLIWIEVLPAIRYFDEYTIPNTEIKASAVALAVFLLMLTTTAARNVPGLVEILLLERLPIDRSARYAIQALTRYAIVLLGATLIGWELNIEWKDLQWLAAALTFGLGFGLQEIFANFVSGLIILFEQPVRVGDIVTIDGTTGTVSRIRMRSTTITDWDRKDYVVPNKEFITGRLLNWTLSDTMTRVKIEVGVTYDADPKDVHRILTETVVTQEHVLEEPPPIVFFESFGDSSLNFTMFAFLPALEHRLPTIHALNSRIHEALGKAGIEIPYPQRDLHIRSSIDVPIARRNRRHNPEVPSPEEIVEAID